MITDDFSTDQNPIGSPYDTLVNSGLAVQLRSNSGSLVTISGSGYGSAKRTDVTFSANQKVTMYVSANPSGSTVGIVLRAEEGEAYGPNFGNMYIAYFLPATVIFRNLYGDTYYQQTYTVNTVAGDSVSMSVNSGSTDDTIRIYVNEALQGTINITSNRHLTGTPGVRIENGGAITYLRIQDDQSNTPTRQLTMAHSGNGSTTPTTGTTTVDSGAGNSIIATATDSTRFDVWSVTSGTASIANSGSASTYCTLTTDATISAGFVPDSANLDTNLVSVVAGWGTLHLQPAKVRFQYGELCTAWTELNSGYQCDSIGYSNGLAAHDTVTNDTVIFRIYDAAATVNVWASAIPSIWTYNGTRFAVDTNQTFGVRCSIKTSFDMLYLYTSTDSSCSRVPFDSVASPSVGTIETFTRPEQNVYYTVGAR
jgi:hypothetical protein